MPRVDVSKPQVMTPSGFAGVTLHHGDDVVDHVCKRCDVAVQIHDRQIDVFFLCKTLKRVLNIRPEVDLLGLERGDDAQALLTVLV